MHDRIDVLGAAFTANNGRVITASDDGLLRSFAFGIPELQERLRELSRDCLPIELCQQYLRESEADARKYFLACDASTAE